MSLTIVAIDATANPDALRGIPSNELGINVEKITAKFTPQVREKLMDIHNEARGFCVSTVPSCALTIAGEVLKITVGALANLFITAFVPVNTFTFFGRTGGFYLTSGELNYERGDWFKTSVEFESDPGIA